MKRLAAFFVLLTLVISGFGIVFPQLSSAQGSGYEITSYHTDIRIGEDNTYHVSETVSANFLEPRHGILRYIPLRQEMEWSGGERRTYNTRVSSIEVTNSPFETYRENQSMVIQIGDPDQYATGKKEYQISFDHALGGDKIESQDFVYYNLIGNDWDCNVENVTFAVTLPKEFNKDEIWFFSGAYGSLEKAPVKYTVEGNTISGSLDKRLSPGEGLTLQMDLPEGYFKTPPPFPWQTVLIIIALTLSAGALLLFFRFGRDGRLVTPVEFYAPEGITSAEAGYIIDTSVDDKDIVSLVLYWASKGFLSIERIGKEDFRLQKLNDLPADARNFERHVFDRLFDRGDAVTISQLKESFYSTVDTAKSLVADHYSTKKNRLYSPSSKALGFLVRCLSAVFLWVSLYIPFYELIYSAGIAAALSAAGTVILMLPLLLLGRTLLNWHAKRRAGRSAALIAGILLVVLVMLLLIAFMATQSMGAAGLAVAAATVLLNVVGVFMRKRTERGSELLGRLLGFKNFLERAEKARIERLVEENPSYFYDVMPYAYVLGVTDKWAKNFEGMAVRPPAWYHDSYGRMDTFSPLVFQAYLFRSMALMRSTMVSRPAQQVNTTRGGFGGGGFHGGGFSGGGFGGGGGRSW